MTLLYVSPTDFCVIQNGAAQAPDEDAVRALLNDEDNAVVVEVVVDSTTGQVQLVSKRALPGGTQPRDVMNNVNLNDALVLITKTHEERKRMRGLNDQAAALAAVDPKLAAKLMEDEKDCDEDEKPVYGVGGETKYEKFERVKRQSAEFVQAVRSLPASYDVVEQACARLRSAFYPNTKQDVDDEDVEMSVLVFHVRGTPFPFFLACCDHTKEISHCAWTMGHRIWACGPLGVLAEVQADRIAMMFSGSPDPIPFRPSYATVEGKLLKDVVPPHFSMNVFADIDVNTTVREISGYFDSRAHGDSMDVKALVDFWGGLSGAERLAIIGNKYGERVASAAKKMRANADEAAERDAGEPPIPLDEVEAEDVDSDEEDSPEASEEGSGDDLDEEDEEEDEDDDEEEDDFVVADTEDEDESSDDESDDESDD